MTPSTGQRRKSLSDRRFRTVAIARLLFDVLLLGDQLVLDGGQHLRPLLLVEERHEVVGPAKLEHRVVLSEEVKSGQWLEISGQSS